MLTPCKWLIESYLYFGVFFLFLVLFLLCGESWNSIILNYVLPFKVRYCTVGKSTRENIYCCVCGMLTICIISKIFQLPTTIISECGRELNWGDLLKNWCLENDKLWAKILIYVARNIKCDSDNKSEIVKKQTKQKSAGTNSQLHNIIIQSSQRFPFHYISFNSREPLLCPFPQL